MVWLRIFKIALVVVYDHKMTPIVFKVIRSKVKVTVTLVEKWFSKLPNNLAKNLQTCCDGWL